MRATPAGAPLDEQLLELMRVIASGDVATASRAIGAAPRFATAGISVGASRTSAEKFFLREIAHYVYAGDTLLHVAAAAYASDLAARLIELGADCRARNRRGAEPLHYACDSNHDAPQAQAETIRRLCAAGADPNARDKSGVGPLHRAVRTRGSAAVATLLELGADARSPNENGSTPLHLAVQNTGRGGTGVETVMERQREIIRLLLGHGAALDDVDGRGKTVLGAAQSGWVRSLLDTHAGR